LPHGFRNFSPWLFGPVVLGPWWHSTSWWEHMTKEVAHLKIAGKQRETGKVLFEACPE
jgi:hypothetical protein